MLYPPICHPVCPMISAWRCIVVVILLFVALPCHARVLEGRVTGISDGDTLTLLVGRQSHKIRLAQIDAPEKNQPYGQRSKLSLSELTYGQIVQAEIEAEDKYGRLVATIWIGGINANLEQVRRGMAWVYVHYAHSAELQLAEQYARRKKRGLWVETKPVPPWEWRQNQRQSRLGDEWDWLLRLVRDQQKTERHNRQAKQIIAFSCGSKHSCQQMTSCDEARFYLTHCGLTRLDGNADGQPCETLCH